ncbi:MAG TPA: Rieske 2Fe-2S domain-containing protein [Cyclobacteriaceae bacterium]|nr:Rieske 2Fe-2S domain-containing protein [Cyclobacteriaceae bacterium]
MNWIKIFTSDAEAKEQIQSEKPRLLIVYGKRICLTRHNDVFYAVQDACSHNGESLSKGKINYLGEIICPFHNYQFDLKTGRECQSRSNDLQTFPVKSDETGFFIGI